MHVIHIDDTHIEVCRKVNDCSILILNHEFDGFEEMVDYIDSSLSELIMNDVLETGIKKEV